MLKINLLPSGARKTSLSAVEQFHRTPLMTIAVAVMVLLPVSLWVPIHFRHRALRELTAQLQVLQPRKVEVDRLQRVLRRLRAQEAAFRGLGKGQDLWAKRLSTLSDVTPDGVWFTDLSLDKAKGLVIQGAAIAQGDPEMASVTRLVQGLKADADFTAAVKDIQIESMKRVPEGEIEVVQFTLACSLQEQPGATPADTKARKIP